MVRKSGYTALILLLFCLLHSSSFAVSPATGVSVIDFDDIGWFSGYQVPDGYGGLDWKNIHVMDVAAMGFSAQYFNGYVAGMVSPGTVAHIYDTLQPAQIKSSLPFDFVSVYLTSAWEDNLEVVVEGYLGSELRYSQTVKLSPIEPFLFEANYRGITELKFTTRGGTGAHWPTRGDGYQFVMDNLSVGSGSVSELTVTIDIKPGSAENPINADSRGVIPVAILSTPQFDVPLNVDPRSLTFGRMGNEASPVRTAFEDVDGDGLVDLVGHFLTQAAGFECEDIEGVLKGTTKKDEPLSGKDHVRIVSCRSQPAAAPSVVR